MAHEIILAVFSARTEKIANKLGMMGITKSSNPSIVNCIKGNNQILENYELFTASNYGLAIVHKSDQY
jgi:hypothetical protein